MSEGVLTFVVPVGAQKDRLMVNLGRERWVYRGVPVRDSVVYRAPGAKVGRRIDVWLFDWAGIPDDVREAMVRSRAMASGVPVDVARAYCETHKHGIPCAEIEVR